jgi:hypothetical protein
MTLDDWYVLAATDADRRNLADLTPVLKGLHGAAKTLRAAAWNDDARGSAVAAASSAFGSPASASSGSASAGSSAPASSSEASTADATSSQPSQSSPRASS